MIHLFMVLLTKMRAPAPPNAVTFDGQPVTHNGQFVTHTE